MDHCDILIKNGRVFSPANKLDQRANVAVSRGKIVGIGSFEGTAERTVDASGCIVMPGLVDIHVHSYPHSDIGVNNDLFCIPNGITSAADAGALGWGTYENQRYYSALRKVDLKFFLNLSGSGFAVHGFPDQMNIDETKGRAQDKIRRLFDLYRDELAGLKLRVSRSSMKDAGEAPVEAALKLAEEVGTKLMIHISDTSIPLNRLASLARPGDILTHCYNDRELTILDKNGQVMPEIWAARKRGVLFDVGNARAHFGFETGIRAIQQGFLPDTISTDTTTLGAYNKPTMFSLPWVLSKFLAIGMDLNQVIACVTQNAASAVYFGRDTGTLTVGGCADIAVLKVIDKEVLFEDHKGVKVAGKQLIKPAATVKSGELLWCDIEL